MEQNQIAFATAEAAWPSPSPAPVHLPATTGEGRSILDFDPVDVRARCDGWTPERQRAFIEELADCGFVREPVRRPREGLAGPACLQQGIGGAIVSAKSTICCGVAVPPG